MLAIGPGGRARLRKGLADQRVVERVRPRCDWTVCMEWKKTIRDTSLKSYVLEEEQGRGGSESEVVDGVTSISWPLRFQ